MQHKEMENVTGIVEDVIFANQENGFTVLELNIGEELLNVVGVMYDVAEGEELTLTGYYTTHPTYGYQFKAELFERKIPSNANAVLKYLSSGVVKGIGKATAKRIVEKFGDETLQIIEEDPSRLAEVKGISQKKAEEFSESFKQIFGVKSLMMFLSKFQITPVQSVAVWKRWGNFAIDMIKQNPYILCDSKLKITFTTCDEIATEQNLPMDSYERITAGISYVLIYNLDNGHTCLPLDKLLVMSAKLLNTGGISLSEEFIQQILLEAVEKQEIILIHKNKDFVALTDYYYAEEYIASRISLMVSIPPMDKGSVDDIIEQIENERGISYESLQKKAIYEALSNDAFILTGGPGTGKTTTLNGIIDVLENQGLDICVAAPTGRAAKRISEVTNREAKTIHRLLEVEFLDGESRFSKNEQNPLDCDVVVIDEMSMVDVMLFSSLLKACKHKCKVIMVGDYNQLPSVGAGNVLQDLLESTVVPTVKLEQIFRQAAQSLIVTNSHKIVRGEIPNLREKNGDFFFMSRRDNESCANTVLELVSTRLPNTYNYSPTDDIQVLCPQRKGDIGVIELNKRLQDVLNPQSSGKVQFKSLLYTYREGDKVMQTKNNYDIEWTKGDEKGLGVFNGDIGIIRMIDRASQTLAIDFEERIAYYSFDMAKELELAYSITVHKSQGSEFDAIVIPIMGGYDKLYYRNLLYTAITRAKKIIIIVGKEERVRFMINNNIKSVRFTNLLHVLKELI